MTDRTSDHATQQHAAPANPWLVTVTSAALRRWGWILAAVVIVIHLGMGYLVGIGDTGATVTDIDRLAYPGVGLLICLVLVPLLRRPRVRANAVGVEVRSVTGASFYRWSDIYGVSFPAKSYTARLELADFEYVPLWALNTLDGEQAVADLTALRDLADRYMPEE